MAAKHIHDSASTPCACGSTRFGLVEDVSMECLSSNTKGWAANFRSDFDVLVCLGCGSTRFFLRPGEGNILDKCHHKVIDITPASPYR